MNLNKDNKERLLQGILHFKRVELSEEGYLPIIKSDTEYVINNSIINPMVYYSVKNTSFGNYEWNKFEPDIDLLDAMFLLEKLSEISGSQWVIYSNKGKFWGIQSIESFGDKFDDYESYDNVGDDICELIVYASIWYLDRTPN